jgi:hypothetical protein
MAAIEAEEKEVFRLTGFDKSKVYETALYTRREGTWPNERYYTSGSLRYLGLHIRSERWGYGDNSGGREVFTQGSVTYDYEGTTCFRECRSRMNPADKLQTIHVGRNASVKLPPHVQRYISEF